MYICEAQNGEETIIALNSDSANPRRRGRWPIYLAVVITSAIGLFAVLFGKSLLGGDSASQPLKPTSVVQLPAPALSSTPLKDALQHRASNREFSKRAFDEQLLSNLLWAADGINRPKTGQRTAPSAYDWRHIEIFLADAQGVGRYDPIRHVVERLSPQDIRPMTGVQDFVKIAPLTLILVSDESEMAKKEFSELRPIFSGVGAGAIAQNVYLFCASEGLNVVVRASLDRAPLHKVLGLGPEKKIVVAQTIGFPPDSSSP